MSESTTTTKLKGLNLFPHEVNPGEHLRCIVRPVKPQPEPGGSVNTCHWVHGGWSTWTKPNEHGGDSCNCRRTNVIVPGTEVYGREKWGEVGHIDWGDPRGESFVHIKGADERCIVYYEEATRHGFEWTDEPDTRGWRPASQMPEWASRFSISFKGVEVKRVGEIADDEALAAGVVSRVVRAGVAMSPNTIYGVGADNDYASHARGGLEQWWDSTFKSLPWSSNPWAWFYQVEVKRK